MSAEALKNPTELEPELTQQLHTEMGRLKGMVKLAIPDRAEAKIITSDATQRWAIYMQPAGTTGPGRPAEFYMILESQEQKAEPTVRERRFRLPGFKPKPIDTGTTEIPSLAYIVLDDQGATTFVSDGVERFYYDENDKSTGQYRIPKDSWQEPPSPETKETVLNILKVAA